MKKYPFPFYHHGMRPTTHDWSYIVRLAAPPPDDIEEKLVELLEEGLSGIHWDVDQDDVWLRVYHYDQIGPDSTPDSVRALQQDVDAALDDLNREFPIVFAAMMEFGEREGGDGWHEWSVRQQPFEKQIAGCPFSDNLS